VDNLDKTLLFELSTNCRISFTSLAMKYKVSISTIKNRVNHLEEQKVIVAYSVTPKLSLLNISTAMIFIHCNNKPEPTFMDSIGSHRLVEIAGIGLGNEGYVVVNYPNTRELNEFTEFLQTLDSVDRYEVYHILLPPGSEGESPTKILNDLKRIDWLILEQLYNNGRKPLSELSKEIGASVPTIRKRLDFLREHHLCHFTILLNPVAISRGFTILFSVTLPSLSIARQLEIEEILRKEMSEQFWVSWKVVDKPVILLGCHLSNTAEVQEIRHKIQKLIPDTQTITDVVAGVAKYYPDIRKEVIQERLASYPDK
jgi:DNA-binding Lrp family transcriptional regulator